MGTEKIIELAILDEESYEKNLIMYVSIGEPRQIAEGIEGEGIDYSILDAKNPEDLTEEEKVALLGRPCHGDNSRIMVRIRESKEFKVTFVMGERPAYLLIAELCGQDDAEGEQLD